MLPNLTLDPREALQDTNAMQEARAQAHAQTARCRALLQAVTDAVLETEGGGAILTANPAAEQALGAPEAELRGSNLRSLLAAVTLEPGLAPQRALVLRPDGASFPAEVRITDWHERGRRRLIVALRPLEVRAGATCTPDSHERGARSRLMESLGALAGGVAHDFGNLVMGIAGCARIAEQQVADPHARVLLAEIGSAAERGMALTRRLLEFVRTPQRLEPVPVDAMVGRAAKLVRQLVGQHIRIEVEPGAPGAVILANPSHIDQLVINLATNARDAMPHGGTLRIWTEEVSRDASERPGRYVRLAVEDTGVGMGEEVKTRAFEPGFTTKAPGVGTGLGLATVQGIARELGGSVEIHSRVGQGTTMSVYLPSGPPPAPTPRAPSPRLPRCSVLVVECEPLVMRAIASQLHRLGVSLHQATTSQAALDVASRIVVDVLVTDVILPEITGPSLVQGLRRLHPNLGVLYISADPHAQLVERGTLATTDAFLQKPFDREALARALAEQVGLPSTEAVGGKPRRQDDRPYFSTRFRS